MDSSAGGMMAALIKLTANAGTASPNPDVVLANDSSPAQWGAQ